MSSIRRRPKGQIWRFFLGLILSGLGLLTISFLSNSSYLLYVGLSFIFWGILLRYVSTKDPTVEFLGYLGISSLRTIDSLLERLGCTGKGLYMPRVLLSGEDRPVLFVSSRMSPKPPPKEEFLSDGIMIKNPHGMVLTPLGLDLMQMFEKRLRKEFGVMSIEELIPVLRIIFVEELQLLEVLDVILQDDLVKVIMRDHSLIAFSPFCTEVTSTSDICSRIGCQVCSSIACALTMTSGKAVAIKKVIHEDEGKRIELTFSLSSV